MELIFPYLRRHGFTHILDFGGGSGDLCMALSEYGFLASYCDVNRVLSDFSLWRFERRGLRIEAADPSDLGNNRFDCVVSFDVFEHLKNLPDKIRQIARAIRPGGSL
ncbi:MAG TPA: class I SAM-dependent methyltransferase, partial [Candidatus Omnitrophota bacterium]|nr:class I SAM-dependent methyltransferase [Candidatus Omnitrophota bacterium]